MLQPSLIDWLSSSEYLFRIPGIMYHADIRLKGGIGDVTPSPGGELLRTREYVYTLMPGCEDVPAACHICISILYLHRQFPLC